MAKIQMTKSFVNLTVQEVFDSFKKKAELRNLSPHTIHYLQESFRYLCKVINPQDSISSLNIDCIDDLTYQLKQKMKDVSINTRLRGIRSFVNYCIRLEYIKPIKVQMLKADTPVKETYTEGELKILLKIPNLKTCLFSEFRTWTAINILIGTGCRIGTLQALKIKDILFDDSMIKFTKTKSRKQILVPITKALHDVLKLFLEYRGGEPEDYLICSQNGAELGRDSIIQAIARYNQRRGISKTSCHLFRHTFAKYWIQNNGDIFRLQKVLGHEDIKITQQYLKDFGSVDLLDNFDRFNPLENLSRSSSKTVSMKKI